MPTKEKQKQFKQVTTSIDFLNDKLDSFQQYIDVAKGSGVLDELQIEQLSIRLEQVKPTYDRFVELLVQLNVLDAEVKPSVKEFEEKYFNVVAEASNMLKRNRVSQSFSNDSSSYNSRHSNTERNVKLPLLNIPEFSGQFSDWSSFIEAFNALIDNNSNLTEVEKFFYLRNALKGSAYEIIHELSATASNYDIAIKMLTERYNNEKLIIFSHLEGLFELNKLTKESALDLRSFCNKLMRHLRALNNINLPDKAFKAAVIAYIIKSKLDRNTAAEFSKFKVRQVPTIEETQAFLSERCIMLENGHDNQTAQSNQYDRKYLTKFPSSKGNGSMRQSFMVTNNKSCSLCDLSHFLFSCPTFLGYTIKQRFNKARELNICRNCLKHDSDKKCFSSYRCKFCQGAHNSLLCFKNDTDTRASNANTASTHVSNEDHSRIPNYSCAGGSKVPDQLSLSCFSCDADQILLSTALVRVKAKDNTWQIARCILDSASQSNFISKEFCARIKVNTCPTNAVVYGINSNASRLNGQAKMRIASLQRNFEADLNCLVINQITQDLPIATFNKLDLDIPSNIKLADPTFNLSAPIDMLIGASLFYELMIPGQLSLGRGKPTLQSTVFGWVLSGNLSKGLQSRNSITMSASCTDDCNLLPNEELSKLLAKFWTIESIEPSNKLSLLSNEEKFCERHFAETTAQDATGRFVVSIPFKSQLAQLGESRKRALDRFHNLERKFQRNPELHDGYSKFIQEYRALGHMTKIEIANTNKHSNDIISVLGGDVRFNAIPYYVLPHHAVFKADSLTTKLRVVFDGSAKTDSNLSINQVQCVGPVVQDNLFSVLLRFRQHKIALTGDIEKMYRMINIDPNLRKFQCILWRDNINEPVQLYELNTVTYGTASASYLATRCLQHVANLNREAFPKACAVIDSSFYMDDLLYTAETVEEILEIKNILTTILGSVGFNIRKFLSNSPDAMTASSEPNSSFFNVPLGERSNAKALGLAWNSLSDMIHYNSNFVIDRNINTKRGILSTISKLFDPMGLLAPIIIKGKIFIQKLWELKVSWDEQIPELLNSHWEQFKNELSALSSVQIPRCVITTPRCTIQLHGFADSSTEAFGACIYLRCMGVAHISSRLLCAKSRVAPLRTISIPRLELCAAVLLAQLMQKVQTSLTISIEQIFLWTDSMVVLNWLNSSPNRFKTFVANRIATIQEHFDSSCWYHVQSQFNPADLISRGVTTSTILTSTLWWHGPKFLLERKEVHNIFKPKLDKLNHLEEKSSCCIIINTASDSFDLFKKYSTLTRLQRVLAWMFRFIANCRLTTKNKKMGYLTVDELNHSLNALVKLCQQEAFPNEIKTLELKLNLNCKCNILPLNPFLDENKFLRVGGRLENSNFDFNKKHPILLPKNHTLTNLIVNHYHHKLLHCGLQQLLSCIRECYWPLSGKNAAKKCIRNCIRCFRVSPRCKAPLMANLPLKRLELNTPVFHNTGLDYAGPILIRDRRTRGSKLIKAYICIFVCLVTRAVHLELVSDLSTNSFLDVLKRFIARRGKPHTLSSDNAKNFVGAYHQLKELYKFLQLRDTQTHVSNYLTTESIKWEFIIPRAPHQGGIWETGVKSMKSHLKKVLGNTHLCFEDLYTVLTQIESVLNSRPLSCLSSDPEDLNPLTPGHFLIGKPLSALPERNLLPMNENRLSLYQRRQRITQHFWKRWSSEVVPELQRRTKWFVHLPDLLQEGSLVLIHEDNQPPLTWPLGRVLELHRASDGVIRSVTVKTSRSGVLKRSVNKLCVLPI